MVRNVVELDHRLVVITDKSRAEYQLYAGDTVTFTSPLSEQVRTQAYRMVHFAPPGPGDRLMFEIPTGGRKDLAGWVGRKGS